jgi:hypothetical protein
MPCFYWENSVAYTAAEAGLFRWESPSGIRSNCLQSPVRARRLALAESRPIRLHSPVCRVPLTPQSQARLGRWGLKMTPQSSLVTKKRTEPARRGARRRARAVPGDTRQRDACITKHAPPIVTKGGRVGACNPVAPRREFLELACVPEWTASLDVPTGSRSFGR